MQEPRRTPTTLPLALVGVLLAAGCGEPADRAPRTVEETASATAGAELPLPTPETDVAREVVEAPAEPEPWTLEPEVREFLWDMEHHGNVLGKLGFGAIKAALIADDEDALREIVSPDFTGSTLAETDDVTVRNAVLAGVRRQPVGDERTPLDRDGLVAFLFDAVRSFHEPPRIGFGVKHISPEDPADLEKPWYVKCFFQLRGETEPGAPREIECILKLRLARPTKERMKEPGWLLSCRIEQITVSSATEPLFRPAEQWLGFDTGRLYDNWDHERRWNVTGGIYACDYDRDGCTDLLVTDIRATGNVLLRGLAEGGFEDVTFAVGLSALQREDHELEALFADLDGDGWEDLLLANGELWRNVEGQRFESVSKLSTLPTLLRERVPSALSVADFDRDGLVDVYVARSGGLPVSWLDDTKANNARNLLLQNRGDWIFEDVTLAVGGDGGARSVFNAVWFDANADGWPDVYVINEFGDGALYVNEQGTSLRELDIDPATDDFGSMGAATGDIDNDGDIDLYVASMYSKAGNRVMGNMPADVYPKSVMDRLWRLISGSELYTNDGDLAFTGCGEQRQVHGVGWAWGTSIADLDNDGWLDIYATAGYMSRDRTKPDG